MKRLKILIISVLYFSCILMISCSENTISTNTSGQITVAASKFVPLNQSTEGHYEAWVSFDTGAADHNESKFNSMGKFNISSSGNIVDLNGAPMVFKFKKPYIVTDAKDAIVTLEPPNDNDTTPGSIFLSGPIAISSLSLDGVLTVDGEDAFGHRGENMMEAGSKVILNTPTSLPDTDYHRGIWTCDTNQNSLFDSLLALPDTIGWIYQGWVVDTTTSPFTYYSAGRFYNPNAPVIDIQPYRGVLPPYSKPGTDWVANNPPDINLLSGKYQFWVTVEPGIETAVATPFFLRIFTLRSIPANTLKGVPLVVENVASEHLPSCIIHINR